MQKTFGRSYFDIHVWGTVFVVCLSFWFYSSRLSTRLINVNQSSLIFMRRFTRLFMFVRWLRRFYCFFFVLSQLQHLPRDWNCECGCYSFAGEDQHLISSVVHLCKEKCGAIEDEWLSPRRIRSIALIFMSCDQHVNISWRATRRSGTLVLHRFHDGEGAFYWLED